MHAYAWRIISAPLALTLAVGACTPSPHTRASVGRRIAAAPPSLQLMLASGDLVVGRNRFTLGFLDNNHPVIPSGVELSFFVLRGSRAQLTQRIAARYNDFARDLPRTDANAVATQIGGVFVAYPTFRFRGNWGVEARVLYQKQIRILRQGFVVRTGSGMPLVGSPAPRSHNPTTAQLPVWKLDSGHPPDDMHTLSIAGAIGRHLPLVVLFATPAFCESRMCGPQTEIVTRVEHQYRSRVSFIHIEVYKNANPRYGYAPTLLQWHLRTEPWVFVINRKGVITAEFEGPTAGSEIRSALDAMLSTKR